MDRRASVPFGASSATLTLYPPQGVATGNATVSIWKGGTGNDSTALITGNAALDSVSLVLAADSGYSEANRKRINVVPTGVNIGRQYIITNDDGQSEVVTVKAKGATYVDAEYDLAYDYDNSATFKGYLQTFTLPGSVATFLSDEQYLNAKDSPYRVLWSYTAGGVTCRHWTLFDVVRQVQQASVTGDDLADVWSDIKYMAGPDRLGRAIGEAQRQLEVDIRIRGYDPANLAPGDMRDNLVKKGAVAILAKQGIAPAGLDPQVHRSDAIGDYMRALEASLSTMERIDGRGGGAATVEPLPLGFVS
jgi:hypothetical protein